MPGFEPGSSGVGSDRSDNCATTAATLIVYLSHVKISWGEKNEISHLQKSNDVEMNGLT